MKLKLTIILFAALVGPAVRLGAGLFAEKQPAQVAASVRNASAGNVMTLPYQIISLPRACDCPRSAVTAPVTSAQAVTGTGATTALSLVSDSTAITTSRNSAGCLVVRNVDQ